MTIGAPEDDRASEASTGSGPAPDLAESLRQLGATGKASASAAVEAAKAFRTLLLADVSLARSAAGRALAFIGLAIAFGASTWLLLMAALIVFLSNGLGWPWSLSLLLTAAISLAVTVFGGWRAMRYFEHTRLLATRRQLARLGIGELADFTPSAKDARGVDPTPP